MANNEIQLLGIVMALNAVALLVATNKSLFLYRKCGTQTCHVQQRLSAGENNWSLLTSCVTENVQFQRSNQKEGRDHCINVTAPVTHYSSTVFHG